MRILALAALTAGFICAQDNKGVAAQWDVAKTLDAIAAHTRRLMPLIEQIHPQDWVAKGAPDTYVSQWNSSRAQAKALIDAASALQRAPERLSGELEALFRLNGLE